MDSFCKREALTSLESSPSPNRRYRVTSELFALDINSSDVLLYAPLKGAAAKVSKQTLSHLSEIEKDTKIPESLTPLLECGIIEENQLSTSSLCISQPAAYEPTSLVLLPSFACNLRCTYCYSFGGENAESKMSIKLALNAINIAIENACKAGNKNVNLGFHGGGEPLMPGNHELIFETVRHFRKKALDLGLSPFVSAVTNGTLSIPALHSLLSSIDRFNISLDGPPDIQNQQRPMADGSGSYAAVLSTINFLEENRVTYGIRSTITKSSVNRMVEIVRHFLSITTLKKFHLEPLFVCGRCAATQEEAPSETDFFKALRKTRQLFRKEGVEIYYSGGRLDLAGSTFCGASGNNMFVCPSGKVTTCVEACRERDPAFAIFNVGYLDSIGLQINENVLANLRSRVVQNIKHCTDCFAKFNCAGDCLVKIYRQSGDIFNTNKNKRCTTNRAVLKDELLEIIKNNKQYKQL